MAPLSLLSRIQKPIIHQLISRVIAVSRSYMVVVHVDASKASHLHPSLWLPLVGDLYLL